MKINAQFLCEKYNIDYYDNQYLEESYDYFLNQEYIHEDYNDILNLVEADSKSIFEKILELIKKAIGFIVSLINKFIELIKNLLTKIKNFIDKKKKNKVKNSTVKAAFITISNDKADITDSVEISSQEQLQSIYIKEIKQITQVMKHNTDEQVKLEKELESKVKSKVS